MSQSGNTLNRDMRRSSDVRYCFSDFEQCSGISKWEKSDWNATENLDRDARHPALNCHSDTSSLLGVLLKRAGRSPIAHAGLSSTCGWFQDRGISLVAGDDAVELLQVVHLVDGHTQLFDFKRARVAQHVASHFRFAVIAGEGKIGGHRKVIADFFVPVRVRTEGFDPSERAPIRRGRDAMMCRWRSL